jgi:3-oxoacyl-[acyl-carrier protein] reductase
MEPILGSIAMSLSLAGKGAIITGGSRGIGFAIADVFARNGAAISFCARGADGVEKALDAIGAHGGKVHGAVCDLADKAELDAYIDDANEAIGGAHILVCNASGFGRTDDEEGWIRGIEIDIMASVRASHAAVPLISANGGGSIIHISTISALAPSLRTPPYGAVKAALNHYARTQALMLAKDGIRVNAICPGSIEFEGGVWDTTRQNNRPLYDRILASIPSGRMGEPEDVADVALFLASDLGRWVTGAVIPVDGGQSLNG